jgi:iron-sulfur cluster repair protein YtfE (RIC family)
MEKIKKKKSEKFMKICLQLLALQFPDVKIKYGYNEILTNMHVVELISENDPESNDTLIEIRSSIGSAFRDRFTGEEEMLFTSANDGTSFKVDHPIATWNIEIDESERVCNKLRQLFLSDEEPIKAPKETIAA